MATAELGTDRRAVATLAVLTLGTFTFVTAETMPIGLLTYMAPALGTSYERIGLLVTGYGLLVAVVSVPLTKLTMRLSRRVLMCSAFALFTASTLVATVAGSYGLLLCARIATAFSHAIFWSLAATTAVSLFSLARRGTVIAVLFTGSSGGAVIGVPLTTWVAENAGWRYAFGLVTLAGLVITVLLLVLLPPAAPGGVDRPRGSAPDRKAYTTLLVVTAVAVLAIFTAQTYVTPFLTDVTGLAPASLAPVLLVTGLTGVLGVLVAGRTVGRRPVLSMVVTLAVSAAAMLALYPLAADPGAVVALTALRVLAFSALGTVVQVRILEVAPGSTDVASAASSSVFNVGIGGGALLGGLVVATSGVQATALVAGVVAIAALGLYAVLTAAPRATRAS